MNWLTLHVTSSIRCPGLDALNRSMKTPNCFVPSRQLLAFARLMNPCTFTGSVIAQSFLMLDTMSTNGVIHVRENLANASRENDSSWSFLGRPPPLLVLHVLILSPQVSDLHSRLSIFPSSLIDFRKRFRMNYALLSIDHGSKRSCQIHILHFAFEFRNRMSFRGIDVAYLNCVSCFRSMNSLHR